VVAALSGRSFGDAGTVALAVSPALTPVDASLGDTFSFKIRATSVFKLGNPTNFGNGSEVTFNVLGITTFGTLVFDTLYQTTGAFATFSTGKVKSISFKFNSLTGKFTETFRTTSKSG
jgi:hypothetical protein